MSALDFPLFVGKYVGRTTEQQASVLMSSTSAPFHSSKTGIHSIHIFLYPHLQLTFCLAVTYIPTNLVSFISPQMAVSVRGLYFMVTLFLGSFFGSVFMLGPVLPLMLLSPAWYRWITDRIVATWLTLPVVCTPAFTEPNSVCARWSEVT